MWGFREMTGRSGRAKGSGGTGRPLHHPLRWAWIGTAALLLVAGRFSAAEAFNSSIEGRWLTDDGKAVVTIGHCGETLCGNISKVLDTAPGVPRTDVNNPEARSRGRPILGLPVLTGFRLNGRRWTGGHAYDPKTGNSYRSVIELNGDGSLKVTGCVLFFCESKRWLRQS